MLRITFDAWDGVSPTLAAMSEAESRPDFNEQSMAASIQADAVRPLEIPFEIVQRLQYIAHKTCYLHLFHV